MYPTLARVAPTVFTGQSAEASSLIIGKNLSAYLFAIGIVLFGLATLKASVYPRWASALLVVSIPATIFLPNTEGTFSESIGQIMFGSAFMILGWHALISKGYAGRDLPARSRLRERIQPIRPSRNKGPRRRSH